MKNVRGGAGTNGGAANSIAEVIDEYADHLHSREVSSHTARAYVADVTDFFDHAAHGANKTYRESVAEGSGSAIDSVAKLGLGDCRAWLVALDDAGAARSTVARKIAALKSFFSYCVNSLGLASNPAARLRTPKKESRLPTVLKPDQAANLISAAHDDDSDPVPDTRTISPKELARMARDSAILELLYATAIRVSELSGLDLADVDHRRSMITVLGKGNKERRVPFGEPARVALDIWLSHRNSMNLDSTQPESTTALFLGLRGGRIGARQVRELVHRYGAKNPDAPDIGPHGLRHSAATHMLDGGADLRQIQELLGHSTMSSTQIYTHVSMKRLQDTYRQAHPRA